MDLQSRRKKASVGKCWSQQGKERIATFYDVLINILLLLIRSCHNKTQVFIAIHNLDSFTIQGPGSSLLVKLHVHFRASYHYFGLVCIELKLVLLGIVGDDVQGTLEATGGVGEQICIISNADSTGADGSNIKTKIGAVQG